MMQLPFRHYMNLCFTSIAWIMLDFVRATALAGEPSQSKGGHFAKLK